MLSTVSNLHRYDQCLMELTLSQPHAITAFISGDVVPASMAGGVRVYYATMDQPLDIIAAPLCMLAWIGKRSPPLCQPKPSSHDSLPFPLLLFSLPPFLSSQSVSFFGVLSSLFSHLLTNIKHREHATGLLAARPCKRRRRLSQKRMGSAFSLVSVPLAPPIP